MKKKIFSKEYFLYDLIRIASMPAFFLVFPTLFFKYKKDKSITRLLKGKAIVVANHRSFMDGLHVIMMYWTRRVHTIVTSELFEKLGPFPRFWVKHTLSIPYDRSLPIDLKCIKKVNEVLENNGVVVIFSEGHVNKEDNIMPLMEGTAMFAMMNKADIYPFVYAKPLRTFHMNYIVVGNYLPYAQLCNPDDGINKDTIKKATNIIYDRLYELYEFGKTKRRN